MDYKGGGGSAGKEFLFHARVYKMVEISELKYRKGLGKLSFW